MAGTSMLASATPPFELNKAIRALKRRAAYWRRVASLATKQVDGYRFQDAPLFNATAMGLDEAIAIVKRHTEGPHR